MKTDFFKDCGTEQETKSAYRHLSKILHPDLGGTCDMFRELNEAYEAKLKSLHGTYNSKDDEKEGKRRYQYDAQVERDLMDMLRALQGLRLPNSVEISLQGTWIWVRGSHKDQFGNYPLSASIVSQLEPLGLKHHTMKGECYYRDGKNRCNNKGKVMRFDRIAAKYRGSKWSNTGSEQVA